MIHSKYKYLNECEGKIKIFKNILGGELKSQMGVMSRPPLTLLENIGSVYPFYSMSMLVIGHLLLY
jgi:hypothetical protein